MSDTLERGTHCITLIISRTDTDTLCTTSTNHQTGFRQNIIKMHRTTKANQQVTTIEGVNKINLQGSKCPREVSRLKVT